MNKYIYAIALFILFTSNSLMARYDDRDYNYDYSQQNRYQDNYRYDNSSYRNKTKSKNDFIISLNAGTSQLAFELESSDSSLQLTNEAEDAIGTFGEISIGYIFNDNYYFDITYAKHDISSILLENTYASFNLILPLDIYIANISPYVGVIAGSTVFTWSESPLKNDIQVDLDNFKITQALIGVQYGMSIDIMDNFSLFAKQQIFANEYSTSIEISSTSTLIYSKLSTTSVGLIFKF